MAKKTRAWYVDKLKKIGIVEKTTNTNTRDGWTSDWGSISVAKDLRIYAISRDADININELTNTFTQIPDQYHEVMVYKAIAMGYKDPRNLNLDLAQYFDNEYLLGTKEAKKFSRASYQSNGQVAAQDF
tara:strand:- start:461 stop:847 length:387 start_codon:yes stop_codon:yes gene_type:complete